MKSAFRYFGLVCMAVSASASTTTMTARPSLGVASARMASAAFARSRIGRTSNYTGGSRHLQGTCSSDAVTISMAANPSSFSISSFDSLAGCYQDTGLIAVGLPYYTPSGLDLPNTHIRGLEVEATGSDSSSTIVRWIIGDYEKPEIMCGSNKPAESIHPAEATWICVSDDSVNEVVSSACGGDCEDSNPGETTCSSETVLVTSSAFPEFEGCYESTGQESEGQPVYSMTGELVEGEPLMQVSNRVFTTTGTEPLVWNLGLAVGSTSLGPCSSTPSANFKHPSDESWSCAYGASEACQDTGDIDGDSQIAIFPSETADTPGLFDVTCGDAATTCNGAASSSPTNTRGDSSSSYDTPASEEDDNGAPAVDSKEGDSEDSDSGDGKGPSSTGGGVGLAVGPTLRVVSAFVGLVLATGFGSYGAV